jgi:glutathione peroxidase
VLRQCTDSIPSLRASYDRRLVQPNLESGLTIPEATPTRGVVDWDDLAGLNGQPPDGGQLAGKAVLVVNVASKCGLTPQYEGLERLQCIYGDRGFSVLGVPCNQFAGQEPGTPDEIEGFCRTTYGTTFPMTAKLEVNGRRRHRLYQRLTAVTDAAGKAGEIEWNFEKFLVAPSGEVLARFRPTVAPEDERIVEQIERALR